MKHYSFPSINQFRNAVRAIQDRARWLGRDPETNEPIFDRNPNYPKLTFRATTKMHGTNAGIVYDLTEQVFSYQSRERVLSLTSDNAGFCLAMSSHEKSGILRDLFTSILEKINNSEIATPKKIAVYGEWCGGSIQKGVALSQVEKMFVIFGVKLLNVDPDNDEEESFNTWIPLDLVKDIEYPEQRIFNALRFGEVRLEIDFAKPELVQNEIVNLVDRVEKECPVGKHFGVSGIGEGLVWTCITPGYSSSKYWFKTKGEKHSASKVKTLASVNVEEIKAINDFVEMAVTENRLIQGLQNLVREQQLEISAENTGAFVKWVYNDVVKEETDTIVSNQLDPKKLGGPISNKARKWYFNKINEGYVVE